MSRARRRTNRGARTVAGGLLRTPACRARPTRWLPPCSTPPPRAPPPDHATHAVGDAGQALAHPERVGDDHQPRALKPPQVLLHRLAEARGALQSAREGGGGGWWWWVGGGAGGARGQEPGQAGRIWTHQDRKEGQTTPPGSPSAEVERGMMSKHVHVSMHAVQPAPPHVLLLPLHQEDDVAGQAGAPRLAVLQQLAQSVHKGQHRACGRGRVGGAADVAAALPAMQAGVRTCACVCLHAHGVASAGLHACVRACMPAALCTRARAHPCCRWCRARTASRPRCACQRGRTSTPPPLRAARRSARRSRRWAWRGR